MSAARAAQSLVGRCLSATPWPRPAAGAPVAAGRQLHGSAPRCKRKTRFRNIKAEELGLLEPSALAKYRKNKFAEYSDAEREALGNKYTPEQLEAIRAGEEAVDPDDMILQGRFRDDPYRPGYVEDYTVLDPRYDVKPEVKTRAQEPAFPEFNDWLDSYGMNLVRLTGKRTSDQLTRAMVRAIRRVKESDGQELIDLTEDELKDIEKDPDLIRKYVISEADEGPEPDANAHGPDVMTRAQAEQLDKAIDDEWVRQVDRATAGDDGAEVEASELELIEDGPAGVVRAHSAEAPELGKVPGVVGLHKSAADADNAGQDEGGEYEDKKRLTGLSLKDIQSVYTKVLVERWVSNQTRLGKVRSSSVVAIAGNGNGRLGLGFAKSTEPTLASETAQLLAIRNMKPVRRYENRTIFGNVRAKVSGTVVELFARPPGFGLRCPHRIFEMCRASGLHDMAARLPRSKNPMNSVKAAYQALLSQPDPDEIAMGRGKKLVDARKVYYGGAVY